MMKTKRGILLSTALLALLLTSIWFLMPEGRESEGKSVEMMHLRQVAIACIIYAVDNEGIFPADLDELHPILGEDERLRAVISSSDLSYYPPKQKYTEVDQNGFFLSYDVRGMGCYKASIGGAISWFQYIKLVGDACREYAYRNNGRFPSELSELYPEFEDDELLMRYMTSPRLSYHPRLIGDPNWQSSYVLLIEENEGVGNHTYSSTGGSDWILPPIPWWQFWKRLGS